MCYKPTDMAYRMGRGGYEVTDAMHYYGPRGATLTETVRQAPRAKARDRSVCSLCSAGSQQSTTEQRSTTEQGAVLRDPKYIKDSYYYQR